MYKIHFMLGILSCLYFKPLAALPVELWFNDKPICQGVSIDPHCVLTAGHCLMSLKIYHGLTNRPIYIFDRQQGKRYNIDRMKIATDFDTPLPALKDGAFHHDWGLIQLTEPIENHTPCFFKYEQGPCVDLWSPLSYQKGESGTAVYDPQTGELIGVHSRTCQPGWSFETLVTQEAVDQLREQLILENASNAF